MASDRSRIAKVRKELRLQNETAVPDSVIESELESSKAEISEEVRQRLNTGSVLSFDGAEEEALENFFKVRVWAETNGKGKGKGRGSPKTVSHMRRHDFGSDKANHWRDRMVSALSKIS